MSFFSDIRCLSGSRLLDIGNLRLTETPTRLLGKAKLCTGLVFRLLSTVTKRAFNPAHHAMLHQTNAEFELSVVELVFFTHNRHLVYLLFS